MVLLELSEFYHLTLYKGMFWLIVILVIAVLTFGITAVMSGTFKMFQTTKGLVDKLPKNGNSDGTGNDQVRGSEEQITDDDDSDIPSGVVPKSQAGGAEIDQIKATNEIDQIKATNEIDQIKAIKGGAETTALVSDYGTGNWTNPPVNPILGPDSDLSKLQPQQTPVGTPARAFVEFGEVASSHPKDIWLDNVALTIPPSNVGITDIIFVDPNRPQQCYQKCKTSPFCRFFSFWKETGSCNLYQTLQNGETTPENMLRYAYTVPFTQHWVSGYVRKQGDLIPPNQL